MEEADERARLLGSLIGRLAPLWHVDAVHQASAMTNESRPRVETNPGDPPFVLAGQLGRMRAG